VAVSRSAKTDDRPDPVGTLSYRTHRLQPSRPLPETGPVDLFAGLGGDGGAVNPEIRE
jgi:hypothetical protein